MSHLARGGEETRRLAAQPRVLLRFLMDGRGKIPAYAGQTQLGRVQTVVRVDVLKLGAQLVGEIDSNEVAGEDLDRVGCDTGGILIAAGALGVLLGRTVVLARRPDVGDDGDLVGEVELVARL